MLKISFSDGTIVDIEDSVLSIFQSYEQRQLWSREAGGVLIGKQVENEDHYILSAVTTPTKHDKRTRFSFTRSILSAQPFINKKWQESNGTENYLGEWHTHPETNPIPSETDKALIRQIVSDKSSPFPKVLLVIVGLNGTIYIGIADSQSSGEISMSKEIEADYEYIRSKK